MGLQQLPRRPPPFARACTSMYPNHIPIHLHRDPFRTISHADAPTSPSLRSLPQPLRLGVAARQQRLQVRSQRAVATPAARRPLGGTPFGRSKRGTPKTGSTGVGGWDGSKAVICGKKGANTNLQHGEGPPPQTAKLPETLVIACLLQVSASLARTSRSAFTFTCRARSKRDPDSRQEGLRHRCF